jgi:hypothetical protein
MFTEHTLVAAGKGASCTVCLQTWSSWKIRSACPGVPVYPFEDLPPYLKTLTALSRERKYPPDPEQWDGAYRILKSPYYRLVYDERKAIHRPLTERQQRAVDRRRQTMRARYGCRLCDTYYRKADAERFRHGVCSHCQGAGASWNRLIEWARHLVREEPLILDITTEPAERPISFTSQGPDIYYNREERRPMIEWWKPGTFLLTGYRVLRLSDGELECQVERITHEEDIFHLRHLVCPQPSALLAFPLVLMVSHCAADIAYRAATAGMGDRELNPNLEVLPLGYNEHARVGRSWTRILEVDSRGHTEREHLEEAASACGIIPEATESIAVLLRRFVIHLSQQETVALEEES